MDWRKAVAYITGTVDEELLLRNEHLSAENRILIQQLQGRLRLTDPAKSKNQKHWPTIGLCVACQDLGRGADRGLARA